MSTTETPVIEQKQSQQRPQQQPQSQPQQQQLQESQQTQQQHQEVVTEQSQTHQNAESSQTNTAAPMIAKKNHPTLKRYFNMMTYGVPPGAVRTKFVAETGLDPVLLEYVIGMFLSFLPSLPTIFMTVCLFSKESSTQMLLCLKLKKLFKKI